MTRLIITEEEANAFFAILVPKHHRRSTVRHDGGYVWSLNFYVGALGMSTHDDDLLTRFVFLCHDRSYRGMVTSSAFGHVRAWICPRDASATTIAEGHPSLHEAVARWRDRMIKSTSARLTIGERSVPVESVSYTKGEGR